ncbi:hypothetical protein V5O48_017897 [Marasmius crinis-equi]|uniref:Uncharacterized protein n=1 Tax=Marasmius crinis-equi TaxID=585013 RepID=A0ABR3EMQ4_9AGAR
MSVFYPKDDDVFFPIRETSKLPTTLNFPVFPEWDANAILSFARHIIVVPDVQYGTKAPPCEPKVYRFDNIPKPHKWSVYMTDANENVPGEGIYPDHPCAHARMPELPHYLEDNEDHIPFYNDKSRNGDEAWVKHGFESIRQA